MSEKGIFHTVRRTAFGRSSMEQQAHERNIKTLKDKLSKVNQDIIDDLSNRYENDDVHEKILGIAGKTALDKFLKELKTLQVELIELKTKFYTDRKDDEVNDVEDVNEAVALWKKESKQIIENSGFRRIAEQYEVWGHEPLELIRSGIREKIVHIRPAA